MNLFAIYTIVDKTLLLQYRHLLCNANTMAFQVAQW